MSADCRQEEVWGELTAMKLLVPTISNNQNFIIMKKLLKLTVAAATLFLVAAMWNCRKTEIDLPETAEITDPNDGHETTLTILRGDFNGKPKSGQSESMMVLGSKKQNPYSVSRMTAAWNNLYSMQYQRLPTTHLYVRFLPQSFEQMDVLDNLDIELLPFPLDYEIIEAGDYYHDPAIPEDQFT
jgi:hypothetical protein